MSNYFISPFMEFQYENIPFTTLDKGVEKCVKEISDSDKGKAIKIISSPTGTGKSFIQDTKLRDYISKYHPQVDIILRLSPTRDVADDGVCMVNGEVMVVKLLLILERIMDFLMLSNKI